MNVGVWLRSLGLGQYEANFRDNKIDADVLPQLTDAGLKDIGVSALGDRLRLLAAIAALSGPTPSVNAPASPTKPAPAGGLQISAERRPITVMFCDLVGSTSLAARLDAEDWRNLVNAYLDEASKAVTDFGGHVLKKLGDGLMALFGYPKAQENDAERAVRAALAIQRALADLNARNARSGAPELSARIGIETGPVVVDATGEVFGEAPNVAARVQAAADPGSVLVTGSVQRQVAGLFVVEEKGAHELKGVAQPLSLYRVVRASGGGRRGGARALTSFVGREEDIGTLLRRWDRVRAGEGQFVQIVGEPGLGKSRLVEEFHSRLGETPHTWVEWNSSQLLQNTPLHPVAEWGRARFGGQDVVAERRLADLETTLAQVRLDVEETAALLAPLLDIPLPAERAPKFAPEELRRRQLAAMVALLLAGARTQPVVLAFEDLHWADPTSLDLIQALAERGAQAPLLVVATTRPEFRAPWGMRSHHAVVALAPLDRTEVRRMVGEIAAQHALPQEVVERVSERTGGVPLFVEEVTRLLLERRDTGSQAVPPTLQQSLAARLDRLGEAREVAQIGAVLGRDFAYSLLRDVAGLDESALQLALERLTEADLLFVEGAPPEANYRFKHALIQDAAYDSLLKSRRQALHRRAAEALREATAEPEAIAHHFTQAGLDDLAIEWWGKAGDQALRRSAFQEAIAHLGKAIAMADKAGGGQPAGRGRQRQELHTAYGNALIAARGHGASETTEAFARARELAVSEKNASERLAADYGLWVGGLVRGELSAMRAHAETFLGDVEANPDSPEAGVAHRVAGTTHWFAGEYSEARARLERALALFQPGRDDDLAFRFGQDVGVSAMIFLALAMWPLGDIERAVSLGRDAAARVAGLAHIGTRAYGKWSAAMFELMRGDLSRAAPNAAETARLAREHDLPVWRAFGVFLEGLAGAQSGAASGLDAMRRGIELLREQNVLIFDGLIKVAFAEAEALAGDVERALAVLDEALATCERIGHRTFEAELHRVRGEMLLKLKHDPANTAAAEEALQTAIAVAKQQSARSFELRAALSLAKLYQSTDRPVEAHAVLAPALEGFSPTPEMPEIAEAQALLGALAETCEVKATELQRKRRLRLQTAYGMATMWAKGYAAEETKAAFARAAELTERTDDFSALVTTAQGRFSAAATAGELRSARELALALRREAEDAGQLIEASMADNFIGLVAYWRGDFVEARAYYERALGAAVPDHDPQFFGYSVLATAHLAATMWQLGEIERARDLINSAVQRAHETGHFGGIADVLFYASWMEVWRGDPLATLSAAKALQEVTREHGIAQYLTEAELHLGWARGLINDPVAGAAEVRNAIAALVEQGVKINLGFYTGLLAELEARAQGPERALVRIEEAFRLSEQVEHGCSLPFLHRLRGEILLTRDPPDPRLAEEAFRTSIAMAKEQGARSPVLLASLALGRLLQSAGRSVEAHVVLAPALKGYSPTPEMTEIAEAQALLAALAESDDFKEEAARRETRMKLHAGYALATMMSKGFSAEETLAATGRTQALAEEINEPPARLAALRARFTADWMGGQIDSARTTAESYLREATAAGSPWNSVLAAIFLGQALLIQGLFADAHAHLVRALDISDANVGMDEAGVRAADLQAYAKAVLALVVWQLGEVPRAREFMDQAQSHAEQSSGAIAIITLALAPWFEQLRGDAKVALRRSEPLAKAAQTSGLPDYVMLAKTYRGWARARLGEGGIGLAAFREGLAQLSASSRMGLTLYQGLLAELESDEPVEALARVEDALRLGDQSNQRWTDAFLHRVRGDLLLKAEPENSRLAEDAFRTAVAIAREQGARSYELLAALSLAKLLQSIGRRIEAQAAIAPALEGFSATPEMPEIAEAKELLAALAHGPAGGGSAQQK